MSSKNLWSQFQMLKQGPYSGHDNMGASVCGFCNEYPGYHEKECPWPHFRDAMLSVWPEWIADLNSYDMQERINAEHSGLSSDPSVEL